MRLLHVALALATIFVCAGIARHGSGRTVSSLVASVVDVTARTKAEQVREASHHWRDGDSGDAAELKAVEADDNDDDDTRFHLLEAAALAVRVLPPPRESRPMSRGELAIDTSRFAAGTCLPRGPPA